MEEEEKKKYEKIFSNNISLSFESTEIEEFYHKESIKDSDIKLLAFLFFIQSCNLLICFGLLDPNKMAISKDSQISMTKIINVIKPVVLGASLAPLILSLFLFLKKKFSRVAWIFDSTNYLFYKIQTDLLVLINLIWVKYLDFEYDYIIVTIYFSFFAIYIYICELKFLKMFLACLLWISIVLIFTPGDIMNRSILNLSSFVCLLIIYFLERYVRNNFHRNYRNKENIWEIKMILKKLNSGLVICQNEKVVYKNDYAKNKLSFLFSDYETQDNLNNSEANFLTVLNVQSKKKKFLKNNRRIKENIFNGIKGYNSDLPSKFLEILTQDQPLNEIFSYLYQENFFHDEFKVIGNKIFREKEVNVYLEMSLKVAEKNRIKYVEFLFHSYPQNNQINKTKDFSQYLQKQSTIFTSLVEKTHSPLNGIISLIEEIKDKNCEKTNKKNLTLIKNLSFYMLMLFKSSNSSNKDELEKEIQIDYNVREEMEVIKGILETLIEIKSKSTGNYINFNIEISDEVQEFIKLKKTILDKILLNLLTNCVKFCEIGSITLKLDLSNFNNMSNKDLTFSIIYSGNKISESDMNLAAIEKLCSKLGSKINLKPNKPNGWIYYFTLEEKNILSSRKENDVNSLQLLKKKTLKKNSKKEHSLNNSYSLKKSFEKSNVLNSDMNRSPSKIFSDEIKEKGELIIKREFLSERISKHENNCPPILKNSKDSLVNLYNNPEYSESIVKILIVDANSENLLNWKKIILEHFAYYYPNTILEIISATDGSECLFKVFNCFLNNTKINFILTSDTMRFMDGLKCREVMNEIFIEKKIKNIPIFLLIDEKDKISDLNCLSNSFKKPLNEQIIEVILNSIYE